MSFFMNFVVVLREIESLLADCSVTIEQLRERRGGEYVELTRIAFINACFARLIPVPVVADHLKHTRATIYRSRQRHDDYCQTSKLYRQLYTILSKSGT